MADSGRLQIYPAADGGGDRPSLKATNTWRRFLGLARWSVSAANWGDAVRELPPTAEPDAGPFALEAIQWAVARV